MLYKEELCGLLPCIATVGAIKTWWIFMDETVGETGEEYRIFWRTLGCLLGKQN